MSLGRSRWPSGVICAGCPFKDPSAIEQFWVTSTTALSKPFTFVFEKFANLKNVLENIFHYSNGTAHLHIDVTLELQKKPRIERHHIAVVGFDGNLRDFRGNQ